jgi:radical SAM family uncharacterized protein
MSTFETPYRTIDFDALERFLPTVDKPSRYIGGEFNQPEIRTQEALRVAVGFPDVYEIGMSHLGIRILYHMLNEPELAPGVACERVFSPWTDMQDLMKAREVPLFTLETRTQVKDLDVLGLSLPYEMLYTNLLDLLELAGIPLNAADRGDDDPLVVVGGPATFNPEPIADFVDVVFLGEAEESLLEFCEALRPLRRGGPTPGGRAERLMAVDGIPGLFFPRLVEWEYGEDGTPREFSYRGVPWNQAQKRIVTDLEYTYYPTRPILPHISIVHDRANVEIHRGCLHGCRYCQAGMITRPHRQRSPEKLREQANELISNTGYEELGLASLNSVDYPDLKGLIQQLNQDFEGQNVAMGLPSLRVDRLSVEIADELQKVKRTHLTLAPEAGSQRLRDVINKLITEEDILNAIRGALDCGWRDLKLYFMVGLPTETDEDLLECATLLEKIAALSEDYPGKKLSVNASFSPFVPQSHTPFQWCGVTPFEVMDRRIKILRQNVKTRRIHVKWRDLRLSEIETAFARGDRRLGEVLRVAHDKGQRFDGWSEHFDYEGWLESFQQVGIDPYWYVYRERDHQEAFPWEVVSAGVDRSFLWRDWERASKEKVVPNCFLDDKCITCGIQAIAC